MIKTVKVKEAIRIAEKLHKQNKTIVLVGGCFDIVHSGHIAFLESAKKQGDYLFVLLENDKTLREIKGENRPIYNQADRAKVLQAIGVVDFVVLLPKLSGDSDYDKLILALKPTIIATTRSDPNKKHKERQAKLTGALVVDVIKKIPNKSTSRLAKILAKNKYL